MQEEHEMTKDDESILFSFLVSQGGDWVGIDHIQGQLGYSLSQLQGLAISMKGEVMFQEDTFAMKTSQDASEDELSSAICDVIHNIKTLQDLRDGFICKRQDKRLCEATKTRKFTLKNSKRKPN